MSGMFESCKSLVSLPDLSKWNIKNADDMKNMFKNCISLAYLPDLDRINYNKTNSIVSGCFSLLDFPNNILEPCFIFRNNY